MKVIDKKSLLDIDITKYTQRFSLKQLFVKKLSSQLRINFEV